MREQDVWNTMAQNEADALALMLASDNRSVMVIVIAADNDADGTTHLTHGVAGRTTGATLRQFILGVERKLEWMREKMVKP